MISTRLRNQSLEKILTNLEIWHKVIFWQNLFLYVKECLSHVFLIVSTDKAFPFGVQQRHIPAWVYFRMTASKVWEQTLHQTSIYLKSDFSLDQVYVAIRRIGNAERLWILNKKIKQKFEYIWQAIDSYYRISF